MKSHSRVLGYGLSWLCVSLPVCGAWAQPENRMRPNAVIAPIVVAPVAVAPLVKGAPVAGVAPLGTSTHGKEVASVGLNSSAIKMPPLVVKLRARELTPEQAWDAGDLGVPDLIYFLESLDKWGGFFWDKDPDLRRQMVALLVEHGQKQLEQPEQLSPVVRLWLADYYQSIGDAKCLTLCESILQEQKEPQKGENVLVFQTLERMAWFYRAQGQFEKAAQAWTKLLTYVPDKTWMSTDAIWQAGRFLFMSGHKEKANQLFDQVEKMDDGFYKGMVYFDKASNLIDDNDPTSARNFLLAKLDSMPISSSRIAPLWMLTTAYCKLEQWVEAEATLQEISDIGQKSNGLPDVDGFQQLYEEAVKRLSVLREWKNKDFEVPQYQASIEPEGEGKFSTKFSIYSWERQPLKVRVDGSGASLVSLNRERALRSRYGILVSIYKITLRASG